MMFQMTCLYSTKCRFLKKSTRIEGSAIFVVENNLIFIFFFDNMYMETKSN